MGSGPIVLAFCTALVAVAAGPACAASRFDALVVFGDSLSDGGNAGRASNGPVWVEYLAASLGLPLAPSTASGTNYATGGALAQGGGYSLRAQADDFLRRIAPGGADPRALYVVWGGANDLRAAVGTPQAGEAVRGAVAAVRSVVADLAAAGARDILLPNLPALGRAPEWHGRAAAATEATALARAFNRGLARALPAAMQGGVRLLRLDVMALLERIAEDPAAAGFANLTDPCRTETAICADPARYVFWDEIHPTTAAHALLARRAAAVLAQPR